MGSWPQSHTGNCCLKCRKMHGVWEGNKACVDRTLIVCCYCVKCNIYQIIVRSQSKWRKLSNERWVSLSYTKESWPSSCWVFYSQIGGVSGNFSLLTLTSSLQGEISHNFHWAKTTTTLSFKQWANQPMSSSYTVNKHSSHERQKWDDLRVLWCKSSHSENRVQVMKVHPLLSANDLFSRQYVIGPTVLWTLLSASSLCRRDGMSSFSSFLFVILPHITQPGLATILHEIKSPIRDLTIISTEKT